MKQIFIVILLITFSHTFSQTKEEKDGDKAFSIQDFERAKNWYKQVYSKEPENAKINFKLATCFVELNLGENALKHINESIQNSQETSKEQYYLKARSLHLTHQFDSAAVYYQKSDPFNANKKEISKKLQECSYGKELLHKPQNYRIRNINQVNSKYHDIAPKISADFEQLYFTSQRKNTEYPEDIYLSYKNGGAWTTPFNVGEPLNSDYNDACVGLSLDGHTMYLYKGVNGGDIYVSELHGKKWSEPKEMPFNTIHRETSISVSPDGKTLYFVRQPLNEKGEKTGNSDIFYCKKTANNSWSKSIKMGSIINTDYDEESPYIHPDGKTLYFSSKGHNSIGGYDVFKSVWDGNNWSTPENLGYPLNTAADERNFVIAANGDYAFYASEKEKGGMGGFDIYFITMPPAPKPNLTLLKGKVFDELNNKPIEADIFITDNETKELVAEFKSNSENGEYLVSLPSGRNYSIRIEKEYHVFYSENIYLNPNSGYINKVENIKLQAIQKGSTMILKNIFFENNSSSLSVSSASELEKLYNFLIENPTISVQISGHTDDTGDETYNLDLSQKRAEAVKNYLTSKGINTERLIAKGYGSSKPIADNKTMDGKAKNRRTEFLIL